MKQPNYLHGILSSYGPFLTITMHRTLNIYRDFPQAMFSFKRVIMYITTLKVSGLTKNA